MSVTSAEVEALVDRVNEVALPADSAGSFYEKFDAWVFADTGAEIRDYLRIVGDRLVLSNAQRAETKERLIFSTPLLSDMEKFLTYHYCNRLREVRRLPRLLVVSIPVTNDKVAPGFAITKAAGPGYELHHSGDPVVRYGVDVQLVKFSHYVGLSPEEIRESALDPEGKPHFMVMA